MLNPTQLTYAHHGPTQINLNNMAEWRKQGAEGQVQSDVGFKGFITSKQCYVLFKGAHMSAVKVKHSVDSGGGGRGEGRPQKSFFVPCAEL